MKKVVVVGGGVAAKGFLGASIALNRDVAYTMIRKNTRGPVPCGIPYAFGIVLSTGSHPVFPPFPGKDLEGIYVIEKDLDKVVALKPVVEAAKSVVIVGGGFIGVESFEGDGHVESVKLADGTQINADLVFVAIGAYPNVDFANKIGLDLDDKRAVKVDAFQQTSDENILAIGDCASKIDIYTEKSSNIRLASIAAKEGRNAALNLFEHKMKFEVRGIMNLFSTSVGGTYFAAAGMTKSQCVNLGYDVVEVSVEAANRHPAALPGTVKTRGFFSLTRRI
ncbi:NAD(P)/FAD-dependent oxidoreductase [Fusibacter tunisiensis]|uniref:Pyruvate/2-oxoglutarate dehydrogenase complex dihydrolipoamide dehydrogenase (E3) component n=1 Tax=Fusibacter tunisiensis TaxID=1008308 RepID=A0ABS2MTJ1_9FIRM|nr:FAD-dependent oxidoreductase [Fusibacter tunisiensis]MBM7562592.1 pyruvate/2-oxoglutarate dehydrogenase complex dihydrolipoamide dehydrogenase (E3) component [Fusibacter tunisiensis]